jgi:N-acetylglucosaminyl-diphospho-decaprenol L-rhamnosyltransferase
MGSNSGRNTRRARGGSVVRPPRVSIVVVTYNSADVVGDCLASIERHAPDCALVVVDNASADDTRGLVRAARPATLIASSENEGFSRANNRGLATVESEFALVLNPDARLTDSTIPRLLEAADRSSDAWALGPLTRDPDGRIQVSFGPDLSPWSEMRQRRLVRGVRAGDSRATAEIASLTAVERDVDWVSGSCMLLRMEPARAVGFFDPRYFLYEEDADLCLRLRRAGGRVRFIPAAEVIHALGTSMAKAGGRSSRHYDESHQLYYRLHRNLIERAILRVTVAAKRLLS